MSVLWLFSIRFLKFLIIIIITVDCRYLELAYLE